MTDPSQIAVVVEIENVYPDAVISTEATAALKAPVSHGPADVWEWAEERLFPLTGTGRTAGPSSYEVVVRRCDDKALEGRTFNFG